MTFICCPTVEIFKNSNDLGYTQETSEFSSKNSILTDLKQKFENTEDALSNYSSSIEDNEDNELNYEDTKEEQETTKEENNLVDMVYDPFRTTALATSEQDRFQSVDTEHPVYSTTIHNYDKRIQGDLITDPYDSIEKLILRQNNPFRDKRLIVFKHYDSMPENMCEYYFVKFKITKFTKVMVKEMDTLGFYSIKCINHESHNTLAIHTLNQLFWLDMSNAGMVQKIQFIFLSGDLQMKNTDTIWKSAKTLVKRHSWALFDIG